jgi:transcriptional regulator with XRE-family HTH domain
MISSPHSPLHERFRSQRRALGVTQSQLAEEVNCAQSAVSMFESGRMDVLSRDKVAAIAAVLDVDLDEIFSVDLAMNGPVSVLKYCPSDECPSNIPYVVRAQLCFQPKMVLAPTAQQTRCAGCGDVLEDCCPDESCCAPVEEGSFCMCCGSAYVTSTRTRTPAWADQQRTRIAAMQELTRTRKLVVAEA